MPPRLTLEFCYQYTEEANKGKPHIEKAMRVFVTDKIIPGPIICYEMSEWLPIFQHCLKDLLQGLSCNYKSGGKACITSYLRKIGSSAQRIRKLYFCALWRMGKSTTGKCRLSHNSGNSNTQYI